jgi:hypothetical protein
MIVKRQKNIDIIIIQLISTDMLLKESNNNDEKRHAKRIIKHPSSYSS